ncbi:taurine transport system ATP-binding protein [Halanaerobium saccharolyticum]|uniref:Taurine transport system ATP-binding protein n=1 Tax=Halanaerobium saccharolyticum TaxID=43595 RepID=A0A4R7YPB6_9FIRM|nr:ABC transporter ATP-binding protein [Halanaerobium saccharolyticum]RAK04030.1 taurine transport system ATP-binding protein [Halanaerobium saccharolyticum]TDV97591.1 taurine transport system ATP-binding protein [Halanaerobium saccharolyticum]TDX49176.1 taurine transport system ATP-binding protein [Halanaerobium saccharolyticum]
MTAQAKKESLIKINNLSLEYGESINSTLALKKIDLEINKGEFICVLGPSGCGKSSLLKCIAGYIKPTSGRVLMQGEEVDGPDWHRGVVFQSPTLYPWMTVNENVEFGPKMRDLPKAEIKDIREYFLNEVNLSGAGENYTFELSGGMKQRVAIARVLANYPQVVLMDEPFGALDALTRENMQNLIRNIWEENNTTIFFITHDVDEALLLANRVVVMSKQPGEIIEIFNVNFTNQIFEKGSKEVIYNEDYFEVKNEIMDIIHNQID